MTKKIFDILPPGRPFRESVKPLPKMTTNRFMNWRFLVLGLIIVVGVSAFLYQVLGTDFTLYLEPNTRIINLETEFRIDGQATEIDFETNILPGYLIVRQESEEQTFTTSGEEVQESRATGIIRVYNAQTPPKSITLVEKTRFISSDGVYFRSPQRITIPAAQIEDGQVVPSFVDVPVEAMDPGETANINPTKFSVPGLLGTDLYDKVYGESLEAMSGGSIQRLAKATQSDLIRAEEALELDLVNNLIAKLESEDKDRVVLSEAVQVEILNVTPSVEVGTLTDQFDCLLEGEIKVLVFSQSKMEEFLAEKIKQRLGREYLVVPNSFYLDYRVFSFDEEAEVLHGNLKFSAEVYRDLEEEAWADQLSGRNRDEVRQLLLADTRIRAFEFRLRPFWLRRVPGADKIEVELRFKS